jgi:hypothetical protein
MKLKIIFFNNMHIEDTYLIQPFIKNIVDNNIDKYEFYYYVCYNYYIYDDLMNINNIINNSYLFEILCNNVDINECVPNDFLYKYLKDEIF